MQIKSLYIALAVAAATATSFIACGPDAGWNKILANEEQANRIFQDSLPYTVKQFKEFSPYFSGQANEMDSTTFTATYPLFNAEIQQLVKNALFIDGEDSVNQVAESFLGGFNEYAEDEIASGNSAFHCWFKNQDARVLLNTGRFLTIANSLSEYTGGAHGMEVELWFNYDIKNKKQLALTDFIQDTVSLKKIVEQHFRKVESLHENDSFGSGYFFDDDKFTMADNFGMTREGLVFHYNVYEIKAYSEGSTTVVVPYKDLKGLLTETGNQLVSSLFKK